MERFCWLSPALCDHGDGEQMYCSRDAILVLMQLHFSYWWVVGTFLVEMVALLWSDSRIAFLAF